MKEFGNLIKRPGCINLEVVPKKQTRACPLLSRRPRGVSTTTSPPLQHSSRQVGAQDPHQHPEQSCTCEPCGLHRFSSGSYTATSHLGAKPGIKRVLPIQRHIIHSCQGTEKPSATTPALLHILVKKSKFPHAHSRCAICQESASSRGLLACSTSFANCDIITVHYHYSGIRPCLYPAVSGSVSVALEDEVWSIVGCRRRCGVTMKESA